MKRSTPQTPGARDNVESSTRPDPRPSERLSPELQKKVSATLNLQNPLEKISIADKSTNRAPLFLIHDGSGICLLYHRIQPSGRTMYAIHDPKFLDPDTWSGIPAMAQAYAKLIKATPTTTSNGPLILGGWSFGGVVAYEAARVLQAQGHAVAGVLLIDSPPPMNHKPLSAAIINDVVGGGGGNGNANGNANGNGKEKGESVRDTVRSLVRKSFISCARMLEVFNPAATTTTATSTSTSTSTRQPIASPRTFLLRSAEGYHLSKTHTNTDRDRDLDDGEMENAWLQDRSDPKSSTLGWEIITGAKVAHADIPGNHFQVFDAVNVSDECMHAVAVTVFFHKVINIM